MLTILKSFQIVGAVVSNQLTYNTLLFLFLSFLF